MRLIFTKLNEHSQEREREQTFWCRHLATTHQQTSIHNYGTYINQHHKHDKNKALERDLKLSYQNHQGGPGD